MDHAKSFTPLHVREDFDIHWESACSIVNFGPDGVLWDHHARMPWLAGVADEQEVGI